MAAEVSRRASSAAIMSFRDCSSISCTPWGEGGVSGWVGGGGCDGRGEGGQSGGDECLWKVGFGWVIGCLCVWVWVSVCVWGEG